MIKFKRKKSINTKKAIISRVIKTRCDETMTDSAFFGSIRSLLRRQWMFYSKKRKACLDASFVSQLRRWQCNKCKHFFFKKDIEVNHIDGFVVSLKKFEDIEPFYNWLWYGEVEAVCKPCHKLITAGQRINKKKQNK